MTRIRFCLHSAELGGHPTLGAALLVIMGLGSAGLTVLAGFVFAAALASAG